MAAQKKSPDDKRPRRPPATTPQARENQIVSLAVDLAEKQILDGTASSAVITHFLKLATTREKLEREKLILESELLRAKSESIASHANMEKLYKEAMEAFRGYKGEEVEEDYED